MEDTSCEYLLDMLDTQQYLSSWFLNELTCCQ